MCIVLHCRLLHRVVDKASLDGIRNKIDSEKRRQAKLSVQKQTSQERTVSQNYISSGGTSALQSPIAPEAKISIDSVTEVSMHSEQSSSSVNVDSRVPEPMDVVEAGPGTSSSMVVDVSRGAGQNIASSSRTGAGLFEGGHVYMPGDVTELNAQQQQVSTHVWIGLIYIYIGEKGKD